MLIRQSLRRSIRHYLLATLISVVLLVACNYFLSTKATDKYVKTQTHLSSTRDARNAADMNRIARVRQDHKGLFSTDYSYENNSVEGRNRQDLSRIKDICAKYAGTPITGNTSGWYLYSTVVDDKNRMLYCYIPKTGCTIWKAISSILTGTVNETNPKKINGYDVHFFLKRSHLHEFNLTEIQKRQDSYFKFVIVRHPFERLVSAYVDKFIDGSNQFFKQKYGPVWIEKYRPNATKDEIKKGVPTFTEYVSHLTDPKTIYYGKDSHWSQYYQLCNPCNVIYDFVVRFETFKEDTKHILKVRKLDKMVNYTYSKPKTTSDTLKKYFGLLTPDQISKLYAAYKPDFELFGYDFDMNDYLN